MALHYDKVTVTALYLQPLGSQAIQRLTSGYKNNIVSGFREAAAKVPADRPDTYNGDAH